MNFFSKLSLSVFFTCFLVLQSCSPDENVNPRSRNNGPSLGADIYGVTEGEHPGISNACGPIIPNFLYNSTGDTAVQAYPEGFGEVKVTNDDAHFFFHYQLGRDWFLISSNIFGGIVTNAPLGINNELDPSAFPYQTAVSPEVNNATIVVPITGIAPECHDWVVNCQIGRLDGFFGGIDQNSIQDLFTGENTLSNGRSFNYCWSECATPPTACIITPGELHTESDDVWGICGSNGTVGATRDANFSSFFPNGLTIGCSNGETITFSSSQDVQSFLPSRGTARVLTQSYANPTGGTNTRINDRSKSDDDDMLLCDCDNGRSQINFQLSANYGSNATIEILDENYNLLTSFANINPGGQRSLTAQNIQANSTILPNKIIFRVGGTNGSTFLIETECDVAIIGNYNEFDILSWEDPSNGVCSSASEDFLPMGNGNCNGSLVNIYRNSLASELLTATLNVTWDNNAPNFSTAQVALSDLIIDEGDFEGTTVADLIIIANDVLGGCNTQVDVSDVKKALEDINENFQNGEDEEFLVCPGNTAPSCDCDDGIKEIQFMLVEDFGGPADINIYRAGGVLITTFPAAQPGQRLTLTSPRSKLDSELEIEVMGGVDPRVEINTTCETEILGSKGDIVILQRTDKEGNSCGN